MPGGMVHSARTARAASINWTATASASEADSASCMNSPSAIVCTFTMSPNRWISMSASRRRGASRGSETETATIAMGSSSGRLCSNSDRGRLPRGPGIPRSGEPKNLDLDRLAFDANSGKLDEVEASIELTARIAADEDVRAEFLGEALDARGQVDRVADQRIGMALGAADV